MNKLIQNSSYCNPIINLKKNNSNDNSLFKIQRYFNNKLYSSKLKIKKRIEFDHFLIGNYSNYDINSPRKIESSLISVKPTIFDRMEKIIRFWKGVCDYSFPKIMDQKLKILKNNCNLDLKKNNFDKNNFYKLPKLNYNSVKGFKKRNFKINFDCSSFNKND
jgi:hypothetical protein